MTGVAVQYWILVARPCLLCFKGKKEDAYSLLSTPEAMPLFCHGVVFSSALAKKSIYLPKFGEAFLQNQDGKNDAVTSKIYNANTDEARTAAGAAAAGTGRVQYVQVPGCRTDGPHMTHAAHTSS